MENEQDKIEWIENNNILNNNCFKLEYEEQELNNSNLVFLNWKKTMQKIYGENAMLFKCSKDKIYFYTSYEECKKYPVYQSECPKCNQDICFYCSRHEEDDFHENGTCCLQRKIKCMFNQDCYRYINPIHNEINIYKFKQAFISFIIPVIHLFTLIAQIQGILYYKLILKNGKSHLRYYQNSKLDDYIELINMGMGVILVIPLFVVHIYFIIFILLISIPFKLIPLKYLLGMHFATINLLEIFF